MLFFIYDLKKNLKLFFMPAEEKMCSEKTSMVDMASPWALAPFPNFSHRLVHEHPWLCPSLSSWATGNFPTF